jgi:hypothetical protein
MATSNKWNPLLPTIDAMLTKIKIIIFQTWKEIFSSKDFETLLAYVTRCLCHKSVEISSLATTTKSDFFNITLNVYNVHVLDPLAMSNAPLLIFQPHLPMFVKQPSSSNHPT